MFYPFRLCFIWNYVEYKLSSVVSLISSFSFYIKLMLSAFHRIINIKKGCITIKN